MKAAHGVRAERPRSRIERLLGSTPYFSFDVSVVKDPREVEST